ncbi:MAG: PspC domain-containing protein [Aquabacterium sp.]|uniref:PspC domain-containing protein n=1 Tax=Aquabacterium sp. TaxID=1872578 RepID=UPI0025BD60D3|nr:PspC domain-containing protein [Aquabacterium sp.]MBI5927636.1 PspC domain-containing protein [Aquabacterium sp.]
MSLADELERLATLHERGVLSAEEFQQAKARLIHQLPQSGDGLPAGASGSLEVSQLRRSRDDRWLGGVCGGIARLTDMESWIWRLIFAAMFMLWGTGLLLYILLWIFVPDD